jgi:ankyrin repeat protein
MTDKWRKMTDDLFEAAEQGRVEDVRRLLRDGVHVDARDQWRRTPLMLAAAARHLPVVRTLLAHGAHPNARDGMTWTAMTCAVNRPSPRFTAHIPWWSSAGVSRPLLDTLVDAGGTVHLREAVILGDIALTESLCEDGADPSGDARWFYHDTYLMVSVDLGHLEVARALLDRGADIEGEDDLGDRALMRAAAAGRVDLASLLLDRGAEIEATNWSSVTALSMAALEGHQDVVELLLRRGAKRDLLDAIAMDDVSLVRSLLERPRDRDGMHNDPDRSCYPRIGRPAMYAARRGNTEILGLLLCHGASPDKQVGEDRPLLAEAARHGHVAVVRLLIEAGAYVDAVGGDELTALEWAVRGGHDEIVQCLREAGARDRSAYE